MGTFDMWAGSMFLLEEFHPKPMPMSRNGLGLSSVTAMALSMEKEKLLKDDERRTKQIHYGYATKEYQYYIKTVPKKERKRGDPHTPDKNGADSVSRRRWDGRVKTWRKAIHSWYDAHSHPSTTATSSLSPSTRSPTQLCSDAGLSEKDRFSENGASSPIDYLTAQAFFANLNIDDKMKDEHHGTPYNNNINRLHSDGAVADVYAGIYYQMMIQQNLILGWIFQHSDSPQFATVCAMLQQFFTQQAVILNCLSHLSPSQKKE